MVLLLLCFIFIVLFCCTESDKIKGDVAIACIASINQIPVKEFYRQKSVCVRQLSLMMLNGWN